jgi:hypothetical protein
VEWIQLAIMALSQKNALFLMWFVNLEGVFGRILVFKFVISFLEGFLVCSLKSD